MYLQNNTRSMATVPQKPRVHKTNARKTNIRVSLPPETAARKREMSSVALIIEFEDGNSRKFWTNEFSASFPKARRGKMDDLCLEFRNWMFFKDKKYAGKVRTAAIFDTRTDKTCRPEYKLMQWDGRVEWVFTNYANLVL